MSDQLINVFNIWIFNYKTFNSTFKSTLAFILLGIISVDFDATSQLLIIYSVFVKYLRKNVNKTKQCISYL
jgi:hypothetical protein